MIQSFRCKETEKIWNGLYSSKLPSDIQNRALRKLRQIDAAQNLNDLRIPPGNHLELLKSEESMSIRINNQWRICFVWKETDAYNVEIVDYH